MDTSLTETRGKFLYKKFDQKELPYSYVMEPICSEATI